MAMVIGIVGLTSVPITTAIRRESCEVRRFSATPLRLLTYLVTDLLLPFAMNLLGILLLFLMGAVVYRVQFEGSLLSLFAGITLGACAIFALGYALASLISGSRVVVIIGNVVPYPQMIFSGAMVPPEVMPDTVRSVSRYHPLTHLVALLRSLWFGERWGGFLAEVIVLSNITILGRLIVASTFRWE